MVPIEYFVEACQDLTLDQFCTEHPYPVLVQEARSKRGIEATRSGEVTIDRMMVGFDDSGPQDFGGDATAGRAAAVPEHYKVFVLRPQSPQQAKGPPRVTLGASREADVRLNDRSVSSIHALIQARGMTIFIEDNNSSAGTEVNDEVLRPGKPQVLQAGDRVSLGFVDLTFYPPADFYALLRQLFVA